MSALEATQTLLRELRDGFDALTSEVESMQSMDAPMPVAILKELEQRDALLKTMQRAPDETKDALRSIYTEELAAAARHDSLPVVPMLPEIETMLDELRESIRRYEILFGPIN